MGGEGMNPLQRARSELAQAQLSYDYERIPAADREAVQDAAREIKPQLSTLAESIIEVGRRLGEIKGRVPHGQWGAWLDTEFHLSERMAQHWMNVADKFGDKSEKFSELPVSTLYLLAAPSTPEEAVTEIEEKLDAGERVTVKQVKEVIELKKPQPKEERRERTASGLPRMGMVDRAAPQVRTFYYPTQMEEEDEPVFAYEDAAADDLAFAAALANTIQLLDADRHRNVAARLGIEPAYQNLIHDLKRIYLAI